MATGDEKPFATVKVPWKILSDVKRKGIAALCMFHEIRPELCREYPGKNDNYTCFNGIRFSPDHD